VLLRQVRAKRPIAEDDLADVLGILQRESGRMSRLVDDMLALARSDAGGQGDLLKQDAVSLEVVVGEAMRTARQLARGQQLELEVIEPVTLYGDGDRLVQVVLIFLDNALRYTKAGGTVTVVVDRATDADEDIACGRITIRDTGCGIQPQHVPHLFERFFRVEDARTRTAGGTGLGLSIALSIVRGHGGWIDVDTAVGRGTTFTVWLPLEHPAEPTAELTGPEPPRVRRPARVFRHGLPKRRPLVQGRRKE
jgi:signal transduction histidine kinase